MASTPAILLSATTIALLGSGWCQHSVTREARSPVERVRLDPVQGSEKAAMSRAPRVPPPIVRAHATKVVLDLDIREHTKTLADGVNYTYWTFGKDCPGPFVRVREGDLIETHLSNHPDNSLPHNISFQGATAPGGGGTASLVEPGHTATFVWRALHPGLYLYQSNAAPAGLQLANGMYGLILVQPRTPLPKVDREYYLVQSEFYTDGAYGARGPQSFSLQKAMRSEPEYVVFNGHVGALGGAGALKAKVGERVRIYAANAGPNLVSSFQIQGVVFDTVYQNGAETPTAHDVQSVSLAPGTSAILEFTARVPGEYPVVDASMFRASNRGASGLLKVSGPPNDLIFTGKTADEPYDPGTHLQQLLAKAGAMSTKPLSTKELMAKGGHVFGTVCFACHQSDGAGLPGKFPPLAGSDFLMADKERSMRIVLNGLKGKITVNGAEYNGAMPKLPLSTQQIAAALTYVRNSFGNHGDPVTVEEVEKMSKETAGESHAPLAQNAHDEP